jgi:hypothetical protein
VQQDDPSGNQDEQPHATPERWRRDDVTPQALDCPSEAARMDDDAQCHQAECREQRLQH